MAHFFFDCFFYSGLIIDALLQVSQSVISVYWLYMLAMHHAASSGSAVKRKLLTHFNASNMQSRPFHLFRKEHLICPLVIIL